MNSPPFTSGLQFNDLLKKSLGLQEVSEDLYNKQRLWFYTFLEYTTQKKELFDFFKNKAEEFELFDGWNKRVLDVGTGNGASLIPLIDRLIQADDQFRDSRLTEVFIDENNLGVMLDFVANYCIDGNRFISLHLNKNRNSTEYSTEENYFDLITASHVFYYMPDWKGTIVPLIRALRPDGKMVIAHTSEQGFLYQFRKEFFPKLGIEELGELRPHSGEELVKTINEVTSDWKKIYVTEAAKSLAMWDFTVNKKRFEREIMKGFALKDLTRKGLSKEVINGYLESQFGSSDIQEISLNDIEVAEGVLQETMKTLENCISEDNFEDPVWMTCEPYLIESKTILNQDNFNEIVSFMLRTDFSKLDSGLKNEISSYINEHSTSKDGNQVLPFKDLGIIVKKHGEKLVTLGKPYLLSDCVDITTRHISAFLFQFLEKELGADLLNKGRLRVRKYLQSKGLNETDLRTLGAVGHTGIEARNEFLRSKGFTKKDLKESNDYILTNCFCIPYERLLYYDFILLDLFLSHPYHANMVYLTACDKTRIVPSLLQPLAYREESKDSLDCEYLLEEKKRRQAFINGFEAMYYVHKNFDYSLKRVRDEYAINECVRVVRPVKPFMDLLKDYQALYKKLGHDKIVIPPGLQSLAANDPFEGVTLHPEKEERVKEIFARFGFLTNGLIL